MQPHVQTEAGFCNTLWTAWGIVVITLCQMDSTDSLMLLGVVYIQLITITAFGWWKSTGDPVRLEGGLDTKNLPDFVECRRAVFVRCPWFRPAADRCCAYSLAEKQKYHLQTWLLQVTIEAHIQKR